MNFKDCAYCILNKRETATLYYSKRVAILFIKQSYFLSSCSLASFQMSEPCVMDLLEHMFTAIVFAFYIIKSLCNIIHNTQSG